jgi:hypothetical protein
VHSNDCPDRRARELFAGREKRDDRRERQQAQTGIKHQRRRKPEQACSRLLPITVSTPVLPLAQEEVRWVCDIADRHDLAPLARAVTATARCRQDGEGGGACRLRRR